MGHKHFIMSIFYWSFSKNQHFTKVVVKYDVDHSDYCDTVSKISSFFLTVINKFTLLCTLLKGLFNILEICKFMLLLRVRCKDSYHSNIWQDTTSSKNIVTIFR